MKVSLGPKTIVHPHPVLLVGSYDSEHKPNLAAVSWGGICCSEPPCIAVSLRKATLSYHYLQLTRAFTVGIPSASQVKIADFVGIYSGREADKFKACGLTAVKAEQVDAPYAEEFPYSLICRVTHINELGLHTQFIGEIVDIKAEQSMLTPKNWPDIEKVKPILYGSFGNSGYYSVGEYLGKAFSIGKELVETTTKAP